LELVTNLLIYNNIDNFKLMDFKKIDIKSVFIVILAIGLIFSFLIGQRMNINYKKDELKSLHKSNEQLLRKNDSLLTVNTVLDQKISQITLLVEQNNKNLSKTQSQLEKLKKKRNEVSSNVNIMSANSVSNAFSDILNKSTKSTNNR